MTGELRALTLVQPWASLIMCGAKTIETRSWLPPKALADGFTFLVHAGQMVDYAWLDTAPVQLKLKAAGLERLPKGAVLGVARCYRAARHPGDLGADTEREQAPFGFFGPGRCYWFLSHVNPNDRLADPIPARGRLGLWRPAPDLEAAVRAGLPNSVWLQP